MTTSGLATTLDGGSRIGLKKWRTMLDRDDFVPLEDHEQRHGWTLAVCTGFNLDFVAAISGWVFTPDPVSNAVADGWRRPHRCLGGEVLALGRTGAGVARTVVTTRRWLS